MFLNTYIVTATNPKGIIFYMAFLPQFIDATGGSTVGQMLILAITFVSLAIVNATLYTINLSGGSLLSAAGLWIASQRL